MPGSTGAVHFLDINNLLHDSRVTAAIFSWPADCCITGIGKLFAPTKLGIKVLWAGSITGKQAYEFGQLGVFGVYVTTAASKKVAVSGTYVCDPGLAEENQPSFAGVSAVKTLLEAGYLSKRVANGGSFAPPPENAEPGSKEEQAHAARLAKALPAAWREFWKAKR